MTFQVFLAFPARRDRTQQDGLFRKQTGNSFVVILKRTNRLLSSLIDCDSGSLGQGSDNGTTLMEELP